MRRRYYRRTQLLMIEHRPSTPSLLTIWFVHFDALKTACTVQYSAKMGRLGCVNSPPAARGSQDAESRNLVFTYYLSTVVSVASIALFWKLFTEKKKRARNGPPIDLPLSPQAKTY